jgi:iron(III) transport system substrate-binding protein
MARAQDARSRLTLLTGFDAGRLAPVLAALGSELQAEIVVDQQDEDVALARLIQGRPADLILIANLARLDLAARSGLFRAVPIAGVERLPPVLRDGERSWTPVASFARMIVVASGRGRPGEIQGYEDLARPGLARRLCLPPPGRPGALAWVASQLRRRGEEATLAWVRGMQANAVRLPAAAWLSIDQPAPAAALVGDDLRLIEAVAAGACDVVMVSSRAVARLGDRPTEADRGLVDRIQVIWTRADQGGTAIDVIGAAVPEGAFRPETSARAVAWLLGDQGQRLLADALYAYPARPGVPLANPLLRWGPFEADRTSLADIAATLDGARALAQRAGWP